MGSCKVWHNKMNVKLEMKIYVPEYQSRDLKARVELDSTYHSSLNNNSLERRISQMGKLEVITSSNIQHKLSYSPSYRYSSTSLCCCLSWIGRWLRLCWMGYEVLRIASWRRWNWNSHTKPFRSKSEEIGYCPNSRRDWDGLCLEFGTSS